MLLSVCTIFKDEDNFDYYKLRISSTVASTLKASGLPSCWISSLFLVTAVKKLPSTGALWHAAAWTEGCVGQMLLRTSSYVSLIVSVQIKWRWFSARSKIKWGGVPLISICKMIHVKFRRCFWVGQWGWIFCSPLPGRLGRLLWHRICWQDKCEKGG